MTATSPLPTAPQGTYAAPPAGFGAPAPRRLRLDRAQIWTIVVAGVIALVATLVAVVVATPGDSSDRGGSPIFGGDESDFSGVYDSYDYDGGYDPDCYSVFC